MKITIAYSPVGYFILSHPVYRTNYRGPVKFDITGLYYMWLLSELGRDDRVVFKGGGGYGFTPPEILRRNFLAMWKITPREMRLLTHSVFALLWCQEKPSGVYKMQETAWATGAPPDPTGHWESLQRSPMPPSWWGGGWLLPSQEPHPTFGLSGLACPHGLIFNPPELKS